MPLPLLRRMPATLLPPSVAAVLLLPLSVLGGGVLFWPAACLVAIAAAVERQHFAMLVWYGLALGFDVQALVLAPLVVALLIRRRVPAVLALVAPLAAAAMLIARAPDLAGIRVLPQDMALSGGAPSLWAAVQALPWIGDLPLTGLALASAAGGAAAFVAWFSARSLDRSAMLNAALLCSLVMPCLLPSLDGRAFLLADALALGIALLDRTAAHWHVAVLVASGSIIAASDAALVPFAALAMLYATALQARAVLGPAANDNPLMPRTA